MTIPTQSDSSQAQALFPPPEPVEENKVVGTPGKEITKRTFGFGEALGDSGKKGVDARTEVSFGFGTR
jgi:hypothetical protein